MKRWQLRNLGEPIDELELVDVEPPTATDGQVVVDVNTVGLTFPDVLQCRGQYQVKTGPGFTPGGEFAGTIVEADGHRRVVALGSGGLAQQVAVAGSHVFTIPDGVSDAIAAAIPVNYGTTHFALVDRARLRAGETLLITGASGGTGSAAIQLGKHLGARVIAVVGGEAKVGLARSLGADEVIDHRANPDWVDAVRELSGGGVDVAYDPVGGDTFHQVRRCMGWDGRLLVIGFVAGIPELATNHVLLKNYAVVGVHWGAAIGRDPELLRREMDELLGLAQDGVVAPPLYPPYAFADAARALQDIASRDTVGKVIVEVR